MACSRGLLSAAPAVGAVFRVSAGTTDDILWSVVRRPRPSSSADRALARRRYQEIAGDLPDEVLQAETVGSENEDELAGEDE